MAIIKVACPRCGQKVSGDETFYGVTVDCPVCTSVIRFPGTMEQVLPKADDTVPEKREEPVLPPVSLGDEKPDALKASREETEPADGEKADSSKDGEKKSPEAPESPAPAPDGKKSGGEVEESLPPREPGPLLGAVSLVSSILAVVTCVGGVFFAPLAIVTGHVASARARASQAEFPPGKNLAAAGLMIGYVALLATILLLAGLLFFADPVKKWLGQFAG